MSRRWFGLRDACEVNPNDPICQEFYGNAPTTPGWFSAAAQHPMTFQIMPGTTSVPTSSTPISPGTIVNTESSSGLTAFWNKIPTPVKLIGAGVLAFIGYKKLVK